MSEELDHRPNDLDERLRGALRDLDRRVGFHLENHADPRTMSTPTGSDAEPKLIVGKPGSRRRLVPTLTGFAVIALLITVGWLARSEQPATPSLHPLPFVTTPTPSPTPGAMASQSEADAARDGVIPALARLPLPERNLPVDPLYHPAPTVRVSTPEGIWLISRPNLDTLRAPRSNCLPQETPPTDLYVLCDEYREILLMTPDLKRILRAYPIPSLRVSWLYLSADGVYCGRRGDGGIPDSMVCRIDRKTMEFTARVFPCDGAECEHGGDYYKNWPGTWKLNRPTDLTGFDQAKLQNGALQILDLEGKPTIRLDPKTLEPQD